LFFFFLFFFLTDLPTPVPAEAKEAEDAAKAVKAAEAAAAAAAKKPTTRFSGSLTVAKPVSTVADRERKRREALEEKARREQASAAGALEEYVPLEVNEALNSASAAMSNVGTALFSAWSGFAGGEDDTAADDEKDDDDDETGSKTPIILPAPGQTIPAPAPEPKDQEDKGKGKEKMSYAAAAAAAAATPTKQAATPTKSTAAGAANDDGPATPSEASSRARSSRFQKPSAKTEADDVMAKALGGM
jgi:hypothetical protein